MDYGLWIVVCVIRCTTWKVFVVKKAQIEGNGNTQ